MEAFGGAERVENLDVKAVTKALEESCRKGLAGGNSVANAGEVKIGTVGTMMIEQCRIVCRDGEEKRGSIAFDIGVDAGGSWARGRENRGGSTGEREVAGIAETVSEKQTGDAEATITFVDFKDGAGIVMRADNHIVMEVYAAFGNACRAGRIEPERRVVFRGALGGEFGRRG